MLLTDNTQIENCCTVSKLLLLALLFLISFPEIEFFTLFLNLYIRNVNALHYLSAQNFLHMQFRAQHTLCHYPDRTRGTKNQSY